MLLSRIRRRACRVLDDGSDRATAGFTLIELIVAMVIIAIVMTALASFYVNTTSVLNLQSGRQVATYLADDAVERVRALKGSDITTGRDRTSAEAQWNNPLGAVVPLLSQAAAVWDTDAAAGSGANAPLPTVPKTSTVNGVAFAQHWYVGGCWQPAAGGDCGATRAGTDDVALYRVVVAVTWPEKSCAANECVYATSTLVSSVGSEPVFNTNGSAQAPAVTNPGALVGEVTVPVSVTMPATTMTATGGAPPITWSGTGLPPGVVINSAGVVSGTPTTPGTYTVTISATDSFRLVGSAGFTWTVNPLPALTSPGDQTSTVGIIVNLLPALTGGTGPFTWAATGLPAGITIDPATGVITGAATTAAPAAPVTVTVTDVHGKAAATTFQWTVQ